MSSICHSIKQEFETLKDLNQAFIVACKEAGDARLLSNEKLRELQEHMYFLAWARDLVREQIEDKEAKLWKGFWNKSMAIVIESPESPYQGMTIAEIFASTAFRHEIIDTIRFYAERGEHEQGCASTAVMWFESACDLGLLDDNQKSMLEKDVAKTKEMASLNVRNNIRDGKTSGYVAWYGIAAFPAVRRLGFLERVDSIKIQMDVKDKVFHQKALSDVMRSVALGRENGGCAEDVIINLSAAFEMGLLHDDETDSLYDAVSRSDFQKVFLAYIPRRFSKEISNGLRPESSIRVMSAIKKLAGLPRRRKTQASS